MLTRVAAVARRAVFGFGTREIGLGVVGLGVLVGASALLSRPSPAELARRRQIQQQLAAGLRAADEYRGRFTALQHQVRAVEQWAAAEHADPMRRWAQERAHRYEALLAAADREAEARALAAGVSNISSLAQRGEWRRATDALGRLTVPEFPTGAGFDALRRTMLEAPLAEFSRDNPDYYRAFRQYEPEASRRDEVALRAEITGTDQRSATPQLMAKVDLLAAVAAADDPIVATWSSATSALDYFEAPDGATLARWADAQQAMHRGDWATAAAKMQAIMKSRVRTRQPFRAALGRALLKSRPDRPTDAYAFMAEAAAAGDRQARAWVADQDVQNHRYAAARHWLEARVADHEPEAVGQLIAVYRLQPASDVDGEVATLEHVTGDPDAPASAWLLLGTLYERVDPPDAKAKAVACYQRAAAKGSADALAEVARCALKGIGTARDPDAARDAAIGAYTAGSQETAAPVLLQLMTEAPETTATAVEVLLGRESIAGEGGYTESRVVDGPGVAALKVQVARYLDAHGRRGAAARLYRGLQDPKSIERYGELTAGHPCETCGGTGKVTVSAPCPTCGGKGTLTCSFCGGAGFVYVPGTPPCGTCGGTGRVRQDGKVVACATCAGTGRGQGTTVKQDCAHCDHGQVDCPDCAGGVVTRRKECPECHGVGTWTLAERGA